MRPLQTFNRVPNRRMNQSLRHRKRAINPLAIDKIIRNGPIATANRATANRATANRATAKAVTSETAMADHAMADHGKGAEINAITDNSNPKMVLMIRPLLQPELT
ncbi:hypothetical protein GCM10027185_46520 [Spirosoma pulveris]